MRGSNGALRSQPSTAVFLPSSFFLLTSYLKLARCPALTHVLPPISTSRFAHLCCSHPRLHSRSYPRHFTLITRTAPCLRQLPSCVAVYPRDSRSRRVLCRASHALHFSFFLLTFLAVPLRAPFLAVAAAVSAAISSWGAVAAATWRPRPRDCELHYIAAATVCGYDLTADVFPRAEKFPVDLGHKQL